MSAKLEGLWDEVLLMFSTLGVDIEVREMDTRAVVLVDKATGEEMKIL